MQAVGSKPLNFYYTPIPESELDLMAKIDELHLIFELGWKFIITYLLKEGRQFRYSF